MILAAFLPAAVIFLAGEILAILVFRVFWRFFGPDVPLGAGKQLLEVFKGALERAFLTLGLTLGFPGVLTLFAALKLANRLRHETGAEKMTDDESDRITNYFLIGNITSVTFCLIYVWLIERRYGELLIDAVGAGRLIGAA